MVVVVAAVVVVDDEGVGRGLVDDVETRPDVVIGGDVVEVTRDVVDERGWVVGAARTSTNLAPV